MSKQGVAILTSARSVNAVNRLSAKTPYLSLTILDYSELSKARKVAEYTRSKPIQI
jgi:hypothetical protein